MSNAALALSEIEKPNPVLSLIRPVAHIGELLAFHQDMRRVIKDLLIEGQDYGMVPGTKKNTLYKAGAEKICIAFGATPKYERVQVEIDHDREVKWQKQKKKWNNKFQGDKTFTIETEEGTSFGLYRYVYKCRIVRSDGRELGEGEGVCSTLESKFIDRPRDCENNVCKMSQKRAFVAGVLNAFGLSDSFTQDLEDNYNPKHSKPINAEIIPPPQSRAPAPEILYDTNNVAMREALQKFFDSRNIDPSYFNELSEALNGRPYKIAEFEAFLKENNL